MNESLLLGRILKNNEAIKHYFGVVDLEDFRNTHLRSIYTVFLDLYVAGEPINFKSFKSTKPIYYWNSCDSEDDEKLFVRLEKGAE